MRSRYSAYVLHKHDYLLATWHMDSRPARSELETDAAQTRWLGLKVIGHADTDPGHAIVEFVARYRVGGGRAVRLHEISRFLLENGRWWYVDGRFVDSAR